MTRSNQNKARNSGGAPNVKKWLLLLHGERNEYCEVVRVVLARFIMDFIMMFEQTNAKNLLKHFCLIAYMVKVQSKWYSLNLSQMCICF